MMYDLVVISVIDILNLILIEAAKDEEVSLEGHSEV